MKKAIIILAWEELRKALGWPALTLHDVRLDFDCDAVEFKVTGDALPDKCAHYHGCHAGHVAKIEPEYKIEEISEFSQFV